MGNAKKTSMQGKRARRAAAICLAVVCSLFAALFAAQGSWGSSGTGQSLVGRIWDSLEEGDDFDAALGEAGAMKLTEANTPVWIEDEVLDGSWTGGAISNQEGSVLWITREGRLDDVLVQMGSELESRGWVLASRDVSEGNILTYVKTKGECRWILAECAQSGTETVAVLHIERS